MREDLERRLHEKHPHILRNLRGDPMVSPLAGGLEIEDGWFGLLEQLLDRIEEHLRLHPDSDFEIRQVKQKFGSLRVYASARTNDVINVLIEEASQQAKSTCERCGGRGASLRSKGGLQVLCTNCAGTAT